MGKGQRLANEANCGKRERNRTAPTLRQEALVVEVVDGGHPSVAAVGMALTPPCPRKRDSDAAQALKRCVQLRRRASRHTWPLIAGKTILGDDRSGRSVQLDDGQMLPSLNVAHRESDLVTACTTTARARRPMALPRTARRR